MEKNDLLKKQQKERFKTLAEKKYKELKSGQKTLKKNTEGKTELTCYGDLLFYIREKQKIDNEFEYEILSNVEKLDLEYFLEDEKENIKDFNSSNLSIVFKRDDRHLNKEFIEKISKSSFIENAKIQIELLGGYFGRPEIDASKYKELKLNLFKNIDTLYFDAGFDLKFLEQNLNIIKNVSNLYLHTVELKLRNETDPKKLEEILKNYASKNSKTQIFSNKNDRTEYREVCTMPKKKKLSSEFNTVPLNF